MIGLKNVDHVWLFCSFFSIFAISHSEKSKFLVLDFACCVIITTRSRMKTFSPYNLPHSIPFNPRRVDSASVYLKRGGRALSVSILLRYNKWPESGNYTNYFQIVPVSVSERRVSDNDAISFRFTKRLGPHKQGSRRSPIKNYDVSG